MVYNRTALVIDDETELADMLRAYLGDRGYNVISANDGKEGLEKVVKEKPDIVLLDIMMPHMDGFEVLSVMKEDSRTRNTPVIVLTAKSESTCMLKAQDMGAADYLIKPFQLGELLTMVERYILK